MDQQVKTKWLTALRSGEYKQGLGALNAGGEFCCLGVLCDLYVKEKPETAKWEDGDYYGVGVKELKIFGEGGLLPAEVMNWAGLQKCDPLVQDTYEDEDGGGTAAFPISSLNDNGKDFSYIAALIEEHL